MNADEYIQREVDERLRERIGNAGRRTFGESPLEGLAPSESSSSRLELKGPVEAVLEMLAEVMAELGLAWCGWCERWESFRSGPIGDTGDHGCWCSTCGMSVDGSIEHAEHEAVWQAVPVLAPKLREVVVLDHIDKLAVRRPDPRERAKMNAAVRRLADRAKALGLRVELPESPNNPPRA